MPVWVSGKPISFRCLINCFGIGQFTRLLPSVEVVAISQAPSPESNPNPPLPSKPWQSTTRPSLADRAVVRQNTPINRLSQNELIQHYLVVLPLLALVLISFIRKTPRCPQTPKRKGGMKWRTSISSCISLAFRQGIQ
jgi:hypothetical protein